MRMFSSAVLAGPAKVALVFVAVGGLSAGAYFAYQTTQGDADSVSGQAGLAATPGEELERSIGRPADGSPIYISLVGDAWRPIFGEENWQKNIVDDDVRVGVTDSAVFQKAATAFQDFPLYWLGLEFQGLPLTGITRSYRQHVTPPEDHVILEYGTCTPSSEGGCRSPVQIRLEPYCYAQPSGFAPEAKEDTVFQVRGADAQYISGALRLWMGDVSVRVSAGSEEEELNVAETIVAANGQGPARSDQQFPPLISEC